MKIIMLGNFSDGQTADYIARSCEHVDIETVYGIDIRKIPQDFTPLEAQDKIIEEVKNIGVSVDIVIVLKGLEIKLSTLKALRELQPEAIFVNWFFDKYLIEEPIWKSESYFDVIKFFDFYFCSLKGVADKLRDKGLANVYYLDEGCFPEAHGETYINHFQEQKYGSDVAFIGSVGFMLQHADRMMILDKIATEGFNLKIWGPRLVDMKLIPKNIRPLITNAPVINEEHSKVVQSSLVNLGIDQDTTIDMGHSARAYRIMCAGGCYLSSATKGLDRMFKVNDRDKEVTADQDLVLFYGAYDLVQKIDFLLEHEDIRKSIAKNGQKAVVENHTFVHRLREMLKIIETEMK